ncbi:general stress protein [Corynebacterium yudongzhengii]|uniref:general stress protein n=1 Tax=Corynebacterium yudongzhengii TaxID=2080740 RepID=UPI001F28B1BF|nr:general stress protein [Corynebacterium yudongzhengii]
MAVNNRRPNRSRPTGWPVGSFTTYEKAQAAVDTLSDNEFPVEHLSIVGVDLIQVENVLGRLTWPKVLLCGAASGAWIGLFIGLLLSIFSPALLGPILWGVIMGAIFGVVMAAVSYGVTGGRRDFTSQTSIVAGRYDVLCSEQYATRARDMIADMGLADQPRRQHPEEMGFAGPTPTENQARLEDRADERSEKDEDLDR